MLSKGTARKGSLWAPTKAYDTEQLRLLGPRIECHHARTRKTKMPSLQHLLENDAAPGLPTRSTVTGSWKPSAAR